MPTTDQYFDVQIGVAYLSGKLQAGYSQALNEMLGIEIDKGESQSNWLGDLCLMNKRLMLLMMSATY